MAGVGIWAGWDLGCLDLLGEGDSKAAPRSVKEAGSPGSHRAVRPLQFNSLAGECSHQECLNRSLTQKQGRLFPVVCPTGERQGLIGMHQAKSRGHGVSRVRREGEQERPGEPCARGGGDYSVVTNELPTGQGTAALSLGWPKGWQNPRSTNLGTCEDQSHELWSQRWLPVADCAMSYTKTFCFSHCHITLFPQSPAMTCQGWQKPVNGLKALNAGIFPLLTLNSFFCPNSYSYEHFRNLIILETSTSL